MKEGSCTSWCSSSGFQEVTEKTKYLKAMEAGGKKTLASSVSGVLSWFCRTRERSWDSLSCSQLRGQKPGVETYCSMSQLERFDWEPNSDDWQIEVVSHTGRAHGTLK